MVQPKRKKYGFLAFCLLPGLICFLVLTVYPLVNGLYMSFFRWSGMSSSREFVGLANYERLFGDPVILQTIANDYFLVIVKILFIMLLAIFFAVVLSQFKFKEAAFYRFVFFFPNIMPVVVTAILWIFIYSNNMGLLNALLRAAGLEGWAKPWLGTTTTALASLAAPLVWAGIGLFMLMLMGGIGNISQSIFEAAEIEGISRWQTFTRITLPLIWPQIKTSIVYIIITTLNGSYVLVQLMTKGGPNNATQVMGSYLYQQAFVNYNFGYGAAIGVMILVLTMGTVLVMQRLLKREEVEY